MGMEIERKFLVTSDAWRKAVTGVHYSQGYIAGDSAATVRVRVAGDAAWLTIKGLTTGVSRPEFEYQIPLDEARYMLNHLCRRPLIDKHRHFIDIEGLTWEVDEFHCENAGLVVAELELEDESQSFTRPSWLGKEITEDHRYRNSNLGVTPFTTWPR
jgi:adenylate cyclase